MGLHFADQDSLSQVSGRTPAVPCTTYSCRWSFRLCALSCWEGPWSSSDFQWSLWTKSLVPQLWWIGPWGTSSREMIWFNMHLGKLASGGIWGTQVEAEVFLGDHQSNGSPGWWDWGRWWNRAALLVYGRRDRQNCWDWMTLRSAEGNLPSSGWMKAPFVDLGDLRPKIMIRLRGRCGVGGRRKIHFCVHTHT